MSFDVQEMLRSKQALRQRLTSLPIAQKLRLLDAMRERAVAIRGANQRQTIEVQERPPSYGKTS